jgi:hypothetical protein
MNMTQKLSLKDQILILNSKLFNYDVKYILSIIEIDLLILSTLHRALDTLVDKLINVVVEHLPSPSARSGGGSSGSQNWLGNYTVTRGNVQLRLEVNERWGELELCSFRASGQLLVSFSKKISTIEH